MQNGVVMIKEQSINEKVEYVRFLKEQMDLIAQSYEAFDLYRYRECIKAIHFESSRLRMDSLRDFCAGYIQLIEMYGFEGVYAKIQEFVDLITRTINAIEPPIE